MNKIAISLLVISLLCGVLAACSSNESPSANGATAAAHPRDTARNGARPGHWRRAESNRDGVPITWEFRDDVDPARRAKLPTLVVVSLVNFARTGPDQRPDAALLDVYDAIERDLIALLADRADLVTVLTFYRQYDWYFYAANGDDVAAIREVLAKAGQQDATVNVENDPRGEFYATLRDRVDAR